MNNSQTFWVRFKNKSPVGFIIGGYGACNKYFTGWWLSFKSPVTMIRACSQKLHFASVSNVSCGKYFMKKSFSHWYIFMQTKLIFYMKRFCTKTPHSRPQSPRSFWPAVGVDSSSRTRFSDYAQSICFVFSTNQIFQIWRKVRESQTSSVGPGQSPTAVKWVRMLKPRARARGNGLHHFHKKQTSAKMAADLNFAVCVSFRKDKPKTKQLRFLP